MLAAKPKERGTCPYCGREKPLTKEHVIPQTLFIELDPDMVTVKVCHQCNHEMSPHIRDLRNWIALSLETITHPDAILHLRKIYETTGYSQLGSQDTLRGRRSRLCYTVR